MSQQVEHATVLLNEAVEALVVDADGVYIDGTFGRGGHSRAILDKLSPKGQLIAFDKDPEAEKVALELQDSEPRFHFVRGSFAELVSVARERGVSGEVKGVLLDLGVSSPQLDDADRGFSFLRDGPLDMRMDPEQGISAAEWLAQARQDDIAAVLWEYGEEKFSRRMARAIVEQREAEPIVRTAQLAEIVSAANPAWEKGKHPATRAFQAIRIFINRELEDLEAALAQVISVLAPGGRLVVISFHSLEDRIVKRFMRDESRGKPLPKGLPVMDKDIERSIRLVGKAVRASDSEVELNPRSRSAVMRVAEKRMVNAA